MSGNFSSPWVVNSRLETCRKKYAKAAQLDQNQLEAKMKEMSFEELRNLEMAGWLVDHQWTDLDCEGQSLFTTKAL